MVRILGILICLGMFKGSHSQSSCSVAPDNLNITSRTGNISYPESGGMYLINEICVWTFLVQEDYVLRLSFYYVDLNGNTTVCGDRLVLPDGKPFCESTYKEWSRAYARTNETGCMHNSTDEIFISTSPNPTLSFYSDSTQHGYGFQLSYSIENCMKENEATVPILTTTTASKTTFNTRTTTTTMDTTTLGTILPTISATVLPSTFSSINTSADSTTGMYVVNPTPVPSATQVGLIAGLASAGVLIAIAIAVGFYYYRRRRKDSLPQEISEINAPNMYESIKRPNPQTEYVEVNRAITQNSPGAVIKMNTSPSGFYENCGTAIPQNSILNKDNAPKVQIPREEIQDDELKEGGYMDPIPKPQPVYLDLDGSSEDETL
ncbi:uncharacterized protein LOC113474146 [Ciona intestinalis]